MLPVLQLLLLEIPQPVALSLSEFFNATAVNKLDGLAETLSHAGSKSSFTTNYVIF